MKKSAVVFFLVVFIGVIFSYIILRIGFLGSEDNFFNAKLRPHFSKYVILRQIFSLHFDGDAKTDFLGKGYGNILIEVDSMDKYDFDLSTLDLLAKKIQEITKKPTTYIFSDENIPYTEALNSQKIKEITKMNRDYFNNQKRAAIYLLVGSRDEKQPSLLGSTLDEYGIVLFMDALLDFTQDSPDNTLVNYEVSTILHEFGHQIGLPHNSEPNCLMNEQVEIHSGVFESLNSIIMDFCDLEKQSIQQ